MIREFRGVPLAVYRPPPEGGETYKERQARVAANRMDRQRQVSLLSAKCGRCGMARSNVVHEEDPEHSIEGPEYFASFLHELHPWEPEP